MFPEILTMTISLVVILPFGSSQKCSGLALEGRETSLSCALSSGNQSLWWQLQIGNNYVNVSTCDATGQCLNQMPTAFQGSRSRTTGQNGGPDTYQGHLKIISANRTQSNLRCVKSENVQSELCSLVIYVVSAKPTCMTPSLAQIGTKTYLNVTCSSERVYPKGNCTFQYRGLPDNNTVEMTATNSPSSLSPGNFKLDCSLLVLISGLSPGSLLFMVEAYPDLGTEYKQEASGYSEWTQPTVLSPPTVALSSDCPAGPNSKNGYIQAGYPATCRCDLRDPGFPPGSVQWYNETVDRLNNPQQDGSSTLTISRNSSGMKFRCKPVSVLRVTEVTDVVFTPRYAVGPTQVLIDMSDSVPLCPGQSLTYQITCKVPRENVLPAPLFTIVINNKTELELQPGQLDKESRFYFLVYNFRPKEGGVQRVFCRAFNEIFTQQYDDHERPLKLPAPPSQAPSLRTSDDQPGPGSSVAYIASGRTAHIICRVEGGHPPGSNITIVCGSKWVSMQGILATLSVEVPEGTTRLLCHCSASHSSNCYNQQSEIILSLDKPESGSSNSSQVSSGPDNTLSLGLGIGLGGVACLLLIFVFIFIFVCKKKRTETSKGVQDIDYSQPNCVAPTSYQYASFIPGAPGPPLPQRTPPYQTGSGDYDLITLESVADQDTLRLASPGRSQRQESSTDYALDSNSTDGYIQPI